jgi:hypothetical protein
MRTKQEVVNFLESLVSTKVVCKGNTSLNGQCVTLIKALMEFLGVPDPYKSRGHAATAISAYLNEGIAKPGTGFLTVFSNENMAAPYGHIWCNAGFNSVSYYESNGQKALTVTKGKTYAYDNVCNFDKYLTEAVPTVPSMNEDIKKLLAYYGVSEVDGVEGLKRKIDEQLGHLEGEREKVGKLEVKLLEKENQLENADKIAANLRKSISDHVCPIIPVEDKPINTTIRPIDGARADGAYLETTFGNQTFRVNYTIEPKK